MPQETRAVALAFMNAMGNLAQIYGAYLFPIEDSPKYLLGFGMVSGMTALGVATCKYPFASCEDWKVFLMTQCRCSCTCRIEEPMKAKVGMDGCIDEVDALMRYLRREL